MVFICRSLLEKQAGEAENFLKVKHYVKFRRFFGRWKSAKREKITKAVSGEYIRAKMADTESASDSAGSGFIWECTTTLKMPWKPGWKQKRISTENFWNCIMMGKEVL